MTKKAYVYIAKIWEKAEHWTFEARIAAPSKEEARAALKRIYPPRAYTIREVMFDNTHAPNFEEAH